MKKPGRGSEEGFALIMVAGIVILLMVMAHSYSYLTRVEALSAFSFGRSVKMKFLAEAGVERGVVELFYRSRNPSVEESDVMGVDGTPIEIAADEGSYSIGITDESGKVDINRTPEVLLRNLLGILGHELEIADTITDSVMDWRDTDDLYRLHGAETDYYQSLPDPYTAKDADFETLEELLLVKGVTPEILHGIDGEKGLINFVTLYSGSGKINLNAAPIEVLLAIPGMTPEIADTLIEVRQAGKIGDVRGVLGQNYQIIAPYTGLSGANIFSVETAGYLDPGGSGYGVRAIIKIEGGSRYRYLYYKSPANIRHDRYSKS